MINYIKSTILLLALDAIYLKSSSNHFNKVVKKFKVVN